MIEIEQNTKQRTVHTIVKESDLQVCRVMLYFVSFGLCQIVHVDVALLILLIFDLGVLFKPIVIIHHKNSTLWLM